MSGEQRLDRSMLEGMKADELKKIAVRAGVPLSGRPTKAGVIEKILQFTGVTVSESSTETAEAKPRRSRTTRTRSPRSEGGADAAAPATSTDGGERGEAASDGASTRPERDAGGTKPAEEAAGASAPAQKASGDRPDKADDAKDGKDAREGSQRRGERQRGFENYAAEGSGGRSSRRRNRNRNRRDRDANYESRVEQAEANFQGEPEPVTGFLEIRDEGPGFLRTKGFLAGNGDVYVPTSVVRKYGLRKGDQVEGACRPAGSNEKYAALLRVDRVNGMALEVAKGRPRFEDLTPLFPDERLRLETPGDPLNMTARIIDLMSPIGKGQRGLIVSPPKAGKTTIMKQIAHSIEANHPEVHLMVLLVDERPEEVTDMRRSVKGEVVASTFDRPADEHTRVAELTIERAKRLVELGKDVVIILDGITRLARAYNLAAPASGRILSGGVDSGALYPPKRFFGAARNIEEGGSLTILATALVETGSKMDEVIFEEFKGTGNMEVRLDRKLADRRFYPAINVNESSTRQEQLLFEGSQLNQVWKLRRVLNALGGQDGNPAAGLELLMDKIKSTRSNDEFLAEIAKNPVPGA